MPTTTKMGIVYPSSTDLVKDGATAMGTISTTVDSKTGLILLNTTNFTAQSTVSIDNLFSTNYRDYRIMMDFNCSTAINLTARLRTTAPADDSTAKYQRQYIFASSTGLSAARTTDQTSWNIATFGNSTNTLIIDLLSPNVTATTTALVHAPYNSGSTSIEYIINAFGMQTSTQYGGISFICNTGNVTGSVSIYGYNK